MNRKLCAWMLGLSLLSPAAAAQHVDWQRHADVDTLEVLTADEDGSPRETTIWLVVVDGAAYIRTSDTTWGANAARSPEIALRVGEQEIPVRAHSVEDGPLRERVNATFREKYGFMDRLTGLMRSANPVIMRLEPR